MLEEKGVSRKGEKGLQLKGIWIDNGTKREKSQSERKKIWAEASNLIRPSHVNKTPKKNKEGGSA